MQCTVTAKDMVSSFMKIQLCGYYLILNGTAVGRVPPAAPRSSTHSWLINHHLSTIPPLHRSGIAVLPLSAPIPMSTSTAPWHSKEPPPSWAIRPGHPRASFHTKLTSHDQGVLYNTYRDTMAAFFLVLHHWCCLLRPSHFYSDRAQIRENKRCLWTNMSMIINLYPSWDVIWDGSGMHPKTKATIECPGYILGWSWDASWDMSQDAWDGSRMLRMGGGFLWVWE